MGLLEELNEVRRVGPQSDGIGVLIRGDSREISLSLHMHKEEVISANEEVVEVYEPREETSE